MNRYGSGVLVGLGVLLLTAAAPVPVQKVDGDAFEAFKQELVGNWRGSGEFNGHPYTDHIRFDVGALGKFVHSEYAVFARDGKQVWHDFGAFGIDPLTGRFFTRGFGSDGATADATLEQFTPGKWVFAGHTDGSPQFQNFRHTLEITARNRLQTVTETQEGDEFKMLFRGSYQKSVEP